MKSNAIHLGTAARAIDLLSTHYGVDQTHLDRIVKDPIRRRQVGLALTGELVISEPTMEEWIEREENILHRLHQYGLPTPELDNKQYEFRDKYGLRAVMEAAWGDGRSVHCRYMPGNLDRLTELFVCEKLGLKLYGENLQRADYASAEKLPTEAGVINCNLRELMQPTDAFHRPHMLDYYQQVAWAKEQGGPSICSAEEVLYLLLRAFVEVGYIPFTWGTIRCRNTAGSDSLASVEFGADKGLRIHHTHQTTRGCGWGAVPRKFSV